MITLKFENFRCFGQGTATVVKPITFLVGENSAGKTSFLAGARFLFEGLSRQSQNAFNRDPYFLGGFEQIAHYRGGRSGRAKKFTLSLEVAASSQMSENTETEGSGGTHRFTFSKGYPQPELESYYFESGIYAFEVTLSQVIPKVTVFISGDPHLVASDRKGFPPSALMRENLGYITHLIDLLRFEPDKTRKDRKDGDYIENPVSRESILQIYRVFRSSTRHLSQQVFASAPVRTQPLRTYNPSEVNASSEGSHVPLELARSKLRNPEAWKRIKSMLVAFGNSSGLFTDIDIRQLGKSDIDPFQVLVKINGPATNLVDVGYGISQVLPLVYQMQTAQRFSTFLLQQPEVHLHPRAQAEVGTLLARTISGDKKPVLIVETHSDFIIDRVGLEIANGTISKDDVTIIFFERDQYASTTTNIYFNSQGELEDAPENFRTFFLEEQARLLGLA